MAKPFFDRGAKKSQDHMLSIDLGTRTTKAVYIQRRGPSLALCGYALLDAPIFEKALSSELLTEHLKSVSQTFGGKSRSVTLTVGINDSLLRTVDMPILSKEDMRLVLKHNSKTYLQQDLTNYLFDCHVIGTSDKAKAAEAAKGAATPRKQRVLVAGARKQLVDEYVSGATNAGLVADNIVPGLIGPANAFEMAMPQVFKEEVVALVDIGFKNSSICILQEGELLLTRTMAIGGDRLTAHMSESMNISYAEAEGIKVGMAQEVQSDLEATLMPLGRELRASIDFFEHQQDKTVSHIYISGGSARSAIIVQALQTQLMIECQVWNPASFMQIELPPEQATELEEVGPQLAVALGTALAAL
jgi:type IV pilus assembly protein PilM